MPHNPEAERGVLGALLVFGAEALATVGGLRVTDFYSPARAAIFGAICQAHADVGACGVIEVAQALRERGALDVAGDVGELLLLQEEATTAHVGYYATLIQEAARKRALIAKCADVADRAYGNEDLAELLAALREVTEDHDALVDDALPMLSLADLAAMGEREQLLDGLLLADSLNEWAGPQKQFKTSTADALCVATATGEPFLGREVTTPGLVMDFALEGIAGKPARYRAHIGAARFNDPDDPIRRRLFLSPTVPDLTSTAGQDALLRTIERLQRATGETLRLAKYDTVARAMSVARLDENSTQDMGAWVAGLDRVRSRIPHAQLVLHHTGKNGLERGSTALPGAVDHLAFISKTDTYEAKLVVRDSRDLEVPDPFLIRFAPVVVGRFKNGSPMSALRIDTFTTTVAAAKDEPQKGEAQQALDALADQVGAAGFDFKAARAATGRAASTTSGLLKRMGLDKFPGEDGNDRWRRRLS